MSNLKSKIMANKKYSNADVKSLKRDEVIKLLEENNIEFDKEQSLFSLRSLLLEVEVDDNVEPEPAQVEEASQEEGVEGEASQDEEPAQVEEKPEPKVDKEVAHAAFQNELSKRMATFGRAKQSVFAIELARRQGKVTGKISFAEELKIRQNKARR